MYFFSWEIPWVPEVLLAFDATYIVHLVKGRLGFPKVVRLFSQSGPSGMGRPDANDRLQRAKFTVRPHTNLQGYINFREIHFNAFRVVSSIEKKVLKTRQE